MDRSTTPDLPLALLAILSLSDLPRALLAILSLCIFPLRCSLLWESEDTEFTEVSSSRRLSTVSFGLRLRAKRCLANEAFLACSAQYLEEKQIAEDSLVPKNKARR